MSIGIGVIGTGKMGSIHLDTITTRLSGVHLAAVSGVDQERTATVAERCCATNHYTDAHKLIGDRAVDAVVICSPAHTHAELAIAALEAGKPVFVEKPLGTSSSDALRVVKAESEAGRRLVQLGFMRRYDAAYLGMKDTVRSSAIGAPLMVHCAHRLAAVPPTFSSEMLITEGLTHEIDAARWLTGQEISTVHVRAPGPSSRAAPGVVDPQFIIMETDGGTLVDVEVSVNAGYAYDIRCEVVCEEGTVELGDFSSYRIRHQQHATSPLAKSWVHRFADAFRAELHAWIDGVITGKPHGPTAWDGYLAAAVADACIQSLHSSEEVPVVSTPRPELYPLGT